MQKLKSTIVIAKLLTVEQFNMKILCIKLANINHSKDDITKLNILPVNVVHSSDNGEITSKITV